MSTGLKNENGLEDKDDTDMEPTARHTIVQALRETASNPVSLPSLMRTWDEQVLSIVLSDKKLTLASLVDKEALTQHFTHALEVFETTKIAQKQKLKTFLDTQGFAAAIASVDGKVLATNAAAESRLSLMPGGHLGDMELDAESVKNLKQELTGTSPQNMQGLFLHCQHRDGSKTLIVVEILSEHGFTNCPKSAVLLLKSCQAEWSDIAAKIITKAFGCTTAELAILKLLCEGHPRKRIAALRKSSGLTVKKQIGTLLNKTQVSSQSELIRLIIGILHVAKTSPVTRRRQHIGWQKQDAFLRLETIKLHDGSKLQYARYGHKKGKPVLLFQLNVNPLAPKFLVREMARAGLQILAPFKPGYGETSPDRGPYDPAKFFANCVQILDHLKLDRVLLAGYCMGGVYAVNGAQQFPSRFLGVALIDTGAPLKHDAQFTSMPPTERRTFMTIRETPDIAYIPYSFAADVFFKDKAGEKMIADIVYADSPRDVALKEQPAMRKIIYDNLDYLLTDTRRTVDDLRYWLSDWEPALIRLAKTKPVVFIHGQEHDWLPADYLERYCAKKKHLSCHIIPGCAQMLIWERPEKFAQVLHNFYANIPD